MPERSRELGSRGHIPLDSAGTVLGYAVKTLPCVKASVTELCGWMTGESPKSQWVELGLSACLVVPPILPACQRGLLGKAGTPPGHQGARPALCSQLPSRRDTVPFGTPLLQGNVRSGRQGTEDVGTFPPFPSLSRRHPLRPLGQTQTEHWPGWWESRALTCRPEHREHRPGPLHPGVRDHRPTGGTGQPVRFPARLWCRHHPGLLRPGPALTVAVAASLVKFARSQCCWMCASACLWPFSAQHVAAHLRLFRLQVPSVGRCHLKVGLRSVPVILSIFSPTVHSAHLRHSARWAVTHHLLRPFGFPACWATLWRCGCRSHVCFLDCRIASIQHISRHTGGAQGRKLQALHPGTCSGSMP